MKTASINNVSVCVSVIVFLLQAVGYLAPGWFVQEVMVLTDSREMQADGRRFSLPYNQNSEGTAGSSQGMGSNGQDKDGTGTTDDTAVEFNSSMDTRHGRSKRHGMGNSDDEGGMAEGGNNDDDEEEPAPTTEGLGHDMDEGNDKETCQDDTTDGNEQRMGGSNDPDNDPASTDMGAKKDKGGIYRMYLTAGLWYSRACITAQNTDSDGGDGVQLCTLYLRTEDRTLEMKTNMFELRIEATLGVVLSALSLAIAATKCCSHRHGSWRAVSALTTLFLSGAVTAIPVVHIIVQHSQLHDIIIRQRQWESLFTNVDVQHDLFDHYSVILCGVASIISILSVVIITVGSCMSNYQKSDNWYSLKQLMDEDGSRHELPVVCAHNSKITVPYVTKLKAETRVSVSDSSEGGYSEARDDYAPPVHDADSVGDCDRLEFVAGEMNTFEKY